jgi:hypothetical protein
MKGNNGNEPARLDKATLRNSTAFPRTLLREKKIWPNDLKQRRDTNTGILVVPQSKQWPEFAMSEGGLNYLHNAVQDEKIPDGVVVLVDRAGDIVDCKPVDEVVAMVAEVTPREGPLGPYWWLNPDFTLNRPYRDDGTAPF